MAGPASGQKLTVVNDWFLAARHAIFRRTVGSTMKHSLWLAMLLGAAPAFSASVGLSEDWGPDRWQGYPDNLDVPKSKWNDDRFVVDVVVNWVSGTQIDDRAVAAVVKNEKLMLCYAWMPKVSDASGTRPAATAPVRLVFTVTDLPRRQYSVSISQACR
jgi:hypothetical protein